MPLQHYAWNRPRPVPDEVKLSLQDFSEAFQSILFQRGISSVEEAIDFLAPQQHAWYSTIQLRGLASACELIRQAVTDQDLITVYGDYDADGVTSTALLVLALQKISAQVIPFLPNRFDSGYGLHELAIRELAERGTKLLITVDNGIRSKTEVSLANSLGLKVIITDHHDPEGDLPDAAALINPKLPDDPYPNKHLAGVGVAYKLVCALSESYPVLDPAEYLDLVAIGTVADVVPLLGENRYLVRRGLRLINSHQRQGLVSLLGAANLTQQEISSSDISYQIAPRLNAAGRLDVDTPAAALNLLLCPDPATCSRHAQELENHNTARKSVSQELQERVLGEITQGSGQDLLLCSFHEGNHLGVAGIAAGFLTRKYYLPAIVGQIGPEFTTASCRSIPEFNIIDALAECASLLTRYGGHALAAGFTIENGKLPDLQEQLQTRAVKLLGSLALKPALDIDAEITLAQINQPLYRELAKLEPTGSHNHQALFLTRSLTPTKITRVGRSSEHLKLSVSDGKFHLDGIGFGLGDLAPVLPAKIDLAYHLTVNTYLGKNEFQLHIQDIKPAGD